MAGTAPTWLPAGSASAIPIGPTPEPWPAAEPGAAAWPAVPAAAASYGTAAADASAAGLRATSCSAGPAPGRSAAAAGPEPTAVCPITPGRTSSGRPGPSTCPKRAAAGPPTERSAAQRVQPAARRRTNKPAPPTAGGARNGSARRGSSVAVVSAPFRLRRTCAREHAARTAEFPREEPEPVRSSGDRPGAGRSAESGGGERYTGACAGSGDRSRARGSASCGDSACSGNAARPGGWARARCSRARSRAHSGCRPSTQDRGRGRTAARGNQPGRIGARREPSSAAREPRRGESGLPAQRRSGRVGPRPRGGAPAVTRDTAGLSRNGAPCPHARSFEHPAPTGPQR